MSQFGDLGMATSFSTHSAIEGLLYFSSGLFFSNKNKVMFCCRVFTVYSSFVLPKDCTLGLPLPELMMMVIVMTMQQYPQLIADSAHSRYTSIPHE